jgi:menaquinone-9 beta-reductase
MKTDYDLVIAGGSIAGAALGFAAQRAGARVLIVEPEQTFRDRVRGESLHPWGVAEVQRLGLAAVLEQAAQAAPYWDTFAGGMRVDRRDLAATTATQLTGFNVHHPELQAALLGAAESAGVEVRRAEKVARIEPGSLVEIEIEGRDSRRVHAALAVIADGRTSTLRRQLGVSVRTEPSSMLTTGVLLEGVRWDSSVIGMFHPAEFGATALLIPLPRERVRLYFIHRDDGGSRERHRYSGSANLPALIARCVQVGVPADVFAEARAIGPLATFETTFCSLEDAELPRGVMFAGDAAGNVDPVYGCGQSMALRDTRVFVEHWRTCGGDWQLAAARYAEDRRTYHAAQLRIEAWLTRILYTQGPAGDALRGATLPRLAELGIDLIGRGPDSPTDDDAEARLFAGIATG